MTGAYVIKLSIKRRLFVEVRSKTNGQLTNKMQAATYNAIPLNAWKLGNITTTPKGLKKIEIQAEDGSKPIFQLWKAGDPYLRAPYGISEPFNGGGGSFPEQNNGTNAPVSVKAMPLELKHPEHLAFAQQFDNCVLNMLCSNQRRVFGDFGDSDEMLPVSMLRRQYCGLVKLSKKPEYPATARIKVNVGNSDMSTSFLRFENQRVVGSDFNALVRNCSVIPILEVQGIWLSSTGGFGVTVQATQVLVMTQGLSQNVGFAGLEFIMNEPESCD